MIKDIEARLHAGEDVPDCLAKTMLVNQRSENLDHLDMTILTSAFMIGGVETVSKLWYIPCLNAEFECGIFKTASVMQWFSALIPAYPEIQKKAQDELDRVVGRDRLPTIEDEKNLPYCHVSIIKYIYWGGSDIDST